MEVWLNIVCKFCKKECFMTSVLLIPAEGLHLISYCDKCKQRLQVYATFDYLMSIEQEGGHHSFYA